jgi:hypothetical protein
MYVSNGSISDGASIATIIGAVVAVVALLATILLARKDALRRDRELSTEKKMALYIDVTQRVFDIDGLFIQHPDLRCYFYEEELVKPNQNLNRITALAEYILDFYSILQEHERLLSDSTPSWKEWNAYIADGFRSSPYLCHYFSKNKGWYEEGLLRIYEHAIQGQGDIIDKQGEELVNGCAVGY